MRVIAFISRVFVGLVFTFSGFVKGVDPLGTAFKMEDYFIAYEMEWAIPLTLSLSILLCTLEFTLGVAMLINLRLKKLSWPLFLLMLFFTVLTFFDAIYEPVPDCGCFGDAIKLTNWETFYKNLVLIVFVIIIFFYRNRYKPWLTPKAANIFVLVIALGFAYFSYYQYRHIPWIDFLGWKVGTDLVPNDPGEAKIYLTYQNTVTGERKEYLSPHYPWNDPEWMEQWEFVDQRTDDSGVIKGHTLQIYDAESYDLTETFISNPDYQFLVVSYSLRLASKKGFRKMDQLYHDIYHDGYSVIVITGSLEHDIQKWRYDKHPEWEIYHADDIELKMMIRSNPGLILLKDGVVLGKWHWRDLPDYQVIKQAFPGM
ncbi:MAG: hypothetical protein K0B08_03155 [Bacteroidales bacterium]|nr:hypothetical protein [Bacteroidales bacterium]